VSCGGCRGKLNNQRQAQHPDCMELENSGAMLQLFPMVTDAGMKLVVSTKRHGFIEIGSYVAAVACSGSTSTTLKRYAGQLSSLAAKTPAKLAQYVGKGLSLAEAIKLL